MGNVKTTEKSNCGNVKTTEKSECGNVRTTEKFENILLKAQEHTGRRVSNYNGVIGPL
jgi:hypothetical protein